MRSALILASIVLSACSGLGTPKAVSSEPLGGPCNTSADCASGLSCQGLQVDPSGQAWEGGNLCTDACGDAGACSSGSTCIDASTIPSSLTGTAATLSGLMCVPTCTSDSDCELGGRAGKCLATDAGTNICEELGYVTGDTACPQPNCGACPSGFSCVANSGSYGFCQKQ